MNDVRDLLKLPIAERLQLIDDLWDSIAADRANQPFTDALKREIDRRLAEHEADPSTALDWDAVRAELRSRGQ